VSPELRNWVLAADVDRALSRSAGDLDIRFVSLAGLIDEI